jgi:DNA uptake protein ComE-like DNA-binding protein
MTGIRRGPGRIPPDARREPRAEAASVARRPGSSPAASTVRAIVPASAGTAAASACGLAIAACALAGAFAVRDQPSLPVLRRVEVPVHRIDIDRAGVAELALLPEIGPGLAARIVAERDAHGAFGSIDALDRVDGIGPARIEALRPAAIASGRLDAEGSGAGVSR